MLTYGDVCWRMMTIMLTYAHVWWRMLTNYADVLWWRMLTCAPQPEMSCVCNDDLVVTAQATTAGSQCYPGPLSFHQCPSVQHWWKSGKWQFVSGFCFVLRCGVWDSPSWDSPSCSVRVSTTSELRHLTSGGQCLVSCSKDTGPWSGCVHFLTVSVSSPSMTPTSKPILETCISVWL